MYACSGSGNEARTRQNSAPDMDTLYDLSRYYFPLDSITNPLVYQYSLDFTSDSVSMSDTLYSVIEKLGMGNFLYKFYDKDYNILDSAFYYQNDTGVYMVKRYYFYETVWVRTLVDGTAIIHKNMRSKGDTTVTAFKSIDQYGSMSETVMKVSFNGFESYVTPAGNTKKLSVIHILTERKITNQDDPEIHYGRESSMVYNMKNIGTVRSVDKSVLGDEVMELKKIIPFEEWERMKAKHHI